MPATNRKDRTPPLRQSQRLSKKRSQLKITSGIPAKRKRSKSQVNLEVSKNKKIKLETTKRLTDKIPKNISLDGKKDDNNETNKNKDSKSTSKINKKKRTTGKHKKEGAMKNEKIKFNKKAGIKATTTPLVQNTFENFFASQLDNTNNELNLRSERCGVCEACQLQDCGECNACRAMCKFGGLGRSKRTCVRRHCRRMADEPKEIKDYQTTEQQELGEIEDKKIKWIGEPIQVDEKQIYYEKVEVDGVKYSLGDFVMVRPELPNVPALVSRLIYMWKEIRTKRAYFHGEFYIRSTYTVLGEVGRAREVFLDDRCYHGVALSDILRKARVEKRDPPKDFFKLGGKEANEELLEDDGKTYFYEKFYERFTSRFEDLPIDPECPNVLRKHRSCPSCERKMELYSSCIPKICGLLPVKTGAVPEVDRFEWTSIKWQNNEYKKGCGVFLRPVIFKSNFENSISQNSTISSRKIKFCAKKRKIRERKMKLKKLKLKLKKVDENVYPEYYRKNDNSRGSNEKTAQPFCVGRIVAVAALDEGPLVAPQEMRLRVNVLYRPENTNHKFPHREDCNLVYWSEEIKEIPFAAVTGLCHLVYVDNIPQQDSICEWLEMDPSRMYFKQSYDRASGKFGPVPDHAKLVGREDGWKGKGKGKGKSNKSSVSKTPEMNVRPLRTLDVFAGCGGLSEGLHRSGVAKCEWAVENLETAAQAYSLNNKNCAVFKQDCNVLLRDVMAGVTHSADGQRLPLRGEVELLVGGPPCQGFSSMNRFNSRQSANFKNSLVATCLSFCDYYRPKYFILENVRNFAVFKKGMVLKLTMRALLAMGYQCTFGVLQAGYYGVPQTRRRLFILAAAPGQRLPLFPESTHVFSQRTGSLNVMIDKKLFTTNIRWEKFAPRRTCTIKDAMSDLPEISNGANKIEIEYGSKPETHFQRLVRSRDESVKLRDHICKNMAPLVQARIARIPTEPGSDWRDLPNTSVKLSDGTTCKVLQYRHEDKKKGRSSTDALRGVCACAAGGACSPDDKQENTLIPWCMPHTANRHNNWAGLYGRISWDGFFSTTVTDPEPMGKQGCVLHPEQHRVVSVRECARSQGFHDTYLFAGSVQDKYRQIGNAVPPPLGAALGREIKKSLSASQ
ncbi:DNA (cytosine-5)-methyltransferase PliMCI-like [Maniola jurtina]|uniref:DNA (cytosine-5)-methyltransferase PliMCI-like n=1 Tax=Maniola jurtina TaxID=191418 RepID=UPI001E687E58|nr:DNA (cytosine-5)-methyltransferase PliMCI-like [Maniola jurtina]